MPPRPSRILKRTLKSIQYDFKSIGAVGMASNLTKGVRAALNKLIRNKDLVISKARQG